MLHFRVFFILLLADVEWGNNDFTIFITISCKNMNLQNFHSAEWLSEWKLSREGLFGKVRINSRFFESGNVALKLNNNWTENILL